MVLDMATGGDAKAATAVLEEGSAQETLRALPWVDRVTVDSLSDDKTQPSGMLLGAIGIVFGILTVFCITSLFYLYVLKRRPRAMIRYADVVRGENLPTTPRGMGTATTYGKAEQYSSPPPPPLPPIYAEIMARAHHHPYIHTKRCCSIEL